MDIYIMDYDILRGTKDNQYNNLFENIPEFYTERRYANMVVESVPKVNEILLYRKNGVLIAMSVYKVVYYDRKIFVIVNNTEGDLRSMERSAETEVPINMMSAASS